MTNVTSESFLADSTVQNGKSASFRHPQNRAREPLSLDGICWVMCEDLPHSPREADSLALLVTQRVSR